MAKTTENRHASQKKKMRWTFGVLHSSLDLSFFLFLGGGMMFITSMPSPLHLCQLADVIYQSILGD